MFLDLRAFLFVSIPVVTAAERGLEAEKTVIGWFELLPEEISCNRSY